MDLNYIFYQSLMWASLC